MITGILIALLCAFMARILLSTSTYPLANFPEIARGHTCVHLLTPRGIPYSPAVMFFEERSRYSLLSPRFIDLYTNKTTTNYKYNSFRRIYMTSPVYGRRSLHQVLRGRPLFQFANMTPAVRKIFDDRNTTWWSRCHQHWMELRSRK